jgi:serine/threonine protein kinase
LRAVKIIHKSGKSDGDLQGFLKETEILRDISHPNIIRIFDMFEDETSCYMVTELCLGGDLFSKIEEHTDKQKSFSEKQAAYIIE